MRLNVLASTAAALLLVSLPAGAAQQQPQPVVQPAHIVVLVDESGSIGSDDMQREREAAALIALGEFAPGSTIAVVGFASDDGGQGQTPVDVVCPPSKVATAQDRQRLSDCVKNLRSRRKEEGQGTDHAAALQQALSYLTGDKDGPKLVFLLTDGKLDVSGSPRYGPDNVGDQRNRAASALVDTVLSQARQEKVAIWPLGFGDVDRAQLEKFAKSSFQGQCSDRSPSPSASIVASSADVDRALLQAFGSGRCAGVGDIQRTPVSPGGTAEVKVTIPMIATDGSIIVMKHDSRVAVSYVDPEGKVVPKSGTQGESTFQVSGENATVEALRVVNPLPGTWTVKITSFPDVPRIDVGTAVLYQGAVRSAMILNPPVPRPGQQVVVELSLQTRSRAIVDPAALRALSFTATMSGADFTTTIQLNDEQRDSDQRRDDGVYTGHVTVPDNATGSIRFVGKVAGIGISGDTRTVDAAIASGPAPLAAVSSFGDTDRTVAPGDSLKGSVTVTNNSGRARKARIIVSDPAPGTLVTIPGEQTVLTLPPSGVSTFDFDLSFASDTVMGANAVTLKVVDDENPQDVIYEWRLTADVEKPPPLTEIAIGISVSAVLVTLLIMFLVHRRRRDVRGLVVHLYEGHRGRGDLAAPERPSPVFRFHLGEADQGVPQLAHAGPGDDTYELRRNGGVLRLRTPYGEDTRCHVGEHVDVTPTLAIKVLDERASLEFPDDPLAADLRDERPADGDHHLL
ncbi:vWA domain-containing protein [Lentzea nigeriaca]|uniref:vWA domain-containing protein n=1 Tax=Lentzea nigeriaca TaxID=1128665 RepID=UPI0019561922|nr:vWA domain-containing protein [Lentzea nigeriaca]MBM7864332.1 hypothetical protein [Lentzea nigeriaca]